jgi:hypothetical protein
LLKKTGFRKRPHKPVNRPLGKAKALADLRNAELRTVSGKEQEHFHCSVNRLYGRLFFQTLLSSCFSSIVAIAELNTLLSNYMRWAQLVKPVLWGNTLGRKLGAFGG